MFLASSHLRSMIQHYHAASTANQKAFLQGEYLRAAADAIDDFALAADAQFSILRKENEELRARVERLEAMIAARPQTDTKPNPAPIIADIEISKESLKQARADIIKAIQFWLFADGGAGGHFQNWHDPAQHETHPPYRVKDGKA